MRGVHFADQQKTSTDSANVTGLSILSRIPYCSNQVQNQISDSLKQAPWIDYSFEPLQPCPSADAKAPFLWSPHRPLQFLPKQYLTWLSNISITKINKKSIHAMSSITLT